MTEVAAAVQLLSRFPPANQAACTAAYHLCTIVGGSAHLTPGPALKRKLKHSYFDSARSSLSSSATPTDWTQASVLGAWEWIRKGTERKVKEWGEVGVAVNDVLGLVQRARSGGNKLTRLEER